MSDFSQEAIDAAGAKVGSGMAYTGSGTAIIGGLSLNEWGVVVGILTAIAGLAVQFWFKYREDQRQTKYWDQKLADERADK